MLNAKLRPGVNLLHVMALTKALGEQLAPRTRSPRSTAGPTAVLPASPASSQGKLVKWTLQRPQAAAREGAAPPAP